jgi:hypothetical protein
VDPNIHPEQSGLSNSSKGDEAVNYLRRLKGTSSGAAAAPVTKEENKAPATTAPYGKERRSSVRLRCSGSAEFRAWGSNTHIWGTLTDISLHGCYVEMNNTFPVNTKVDHVLKSCGVRIEVSGSVRTSYPALGMGLAFVDIKPDQQLQLNQLLASLGGQSAFFRGAPEREPATHKPVRLSDPHALLDAMTEYFRKNSALSREEFHEIARRFRRS